MQAGPALNFVRSNIIEMELDLIKNLSTTKTNSGFGELESLFKDSFFQKRVGLRVFGGEMLLFLLCAGEGISVTALLEYQWCEGIFDLDACPPFSLSLRQPQWVKVHCTSVKFVKFPGDSEGSKEGILYK